MAEVLNGEILAEYQDVLSRKKLKLDEALREKWLNLIQASTKLVSVSLEIDFPRDQKDAKFLACAIDANADFLITGVRDFSEIKVFGNTAIISVSLFEQLILNQDKNRD